MSFLQELLNHQAELESSLTGVDLLKLSRDLLKNRIFSRDAYEKLTYLDPDEDHLEPEVKVRYFLQLVYSRVEVDNSLFGRLVKALSRLRGEVEKVCTKIKEEMAKKCGDDKEKQNSSVLLTLSDISLLVERIVGGS